MKKSEEKLVPTSSLEALWDQVADALEKEIKKLTESGFSDDYKELKSRINLEDTIGIYQWLKNQPWLEGEVNNQFNQRFPAYKAKKIDDLKDAEPSAYHFPVTTYITCDHKGNIYIDFDPNSKLARDTKDSAIKKEPPPKSGKKPIKYINHGAQKTVRKAWSLNITTGQIEPSVALVSKGHKAIQALKQECQMYQPENPLLWPIRGFIEYSGHDPKIKNNQPKAIAFARRADGDVFEFLENIIRYQPQPDLGDLLWMSYSMIKAVALFNTAGRLHRDIRPENFLFVRNEHGFCSYLSDLGLSINQDQAETPCLVGAAAYTPFDHPVYKPIIELHSELIQEISEFQYVYDNTGDLDEKKKEYYPIYQSLRESGLDKETVKSAYLAKMTSRVKNHALKLPLKYAEPDSHSFALSIILQRESSSFLVGSYNDPKTETWSLCLTLYHLQRFFLQIIAADSPLVIFLQKAVHMNLMANYTERTTTAELLEAVEAVFKEAINVATSQQPHLVKFLTQLHYHKLSLPGLTVTSEELEKKTTTGTSSVYKNSSITLFDQPDSSSVTTSSTMATTKTLSS